MKKNFKALKRTVAFMICAVLCLGLLPVSAAEVGDNRLSIGSMDTQDYALGTANVINKFSYAAQSDITVADFQITQAAPSFKLKEGSDTDKVLATGFAADGTSGSNFVYACNDLLTAEPIQVWQIKVKLPSVDGGQETRLFYYGANGQWKGHNRNATSSVCLKNGGVYLVGDNPASGTYTYNVIPDNTMKADTWYNVVRVMDFSNVSDNKQLVYVYELSDSGASTLVGRTDSWRRAGEIPAAFTGNPNNPAFLIRSLACFVKGYKASVEFDDLTAGTSQYKLGSVSIADANKIAMLDATTDSYRTLSTKAPWLFRLEHQYSIRVKLPVIDANSEVKLFSLSDTNSGNYIAPTLNRAVIAIKGGKVYTSTYDGSTVTETPIKDSTSADVVLKPNTWYQFDIKGYLGEGTNVEAAQAGKYTIYVKEDSTLLAETTITKETYAQQNAGVFYAMSLISAKGFSKPIYFDNLQANVMLPGTTTAWLKTIHDFESNQTGDALTTVVTSMQGTTEYTYVPHTDISGANAYVVGDYTGTYLDLNGDALYSVTPDPINLKFTSPIDESTFNKENVIFKVNGEAVTDGYTLSYDAATATGTITFDRLAYETGYSLEILPSILSKDLNLPLPVGAQFSFCTPEDNFKIDAVKFQRASGSGYVDIEDLTAGLGIGAKVRANVSMTNDSPEDRDYLVICAVLSKENRMLNLKATSGKIPAGAVYSGDTAITTELIPIEESGTRIEIYVWDNWKQMMPRTGKLVLKKQ